MTIDSYFDRVFYINLDSDHSRKSAMEEKLAQVGIRNYERVPGVKIGVLPQIQFWRNFIKNDLKYLLGSLGCRESHLECIRIAKKKGYKKILILEDDAVFLNDPNTILSSNVQNVPDWDLMYFGGLIEPHFRNQVVCLHAYGLSETVFDDVLNMAGPSGMEIDNFYAKILQHMSRNDRRLGKYCTLLVEPFNSIVQDKTYSSNIQTPELRTSTSLH